MALAAGRAGSLLRGTNLDIYQDVGALLRVADTPRNSSTGGELQYLTLGR